LKFNYENTLIFFPTLGTMRKVFPSS